MRRPFRAVVVLGAAAAAALLAAPPAAALDRLTMKNGRSVLGEVVERDEETILFRTTVGDMRVPRSEIASIEAVKPPAEAQPADASGTAAESPRQATPARPAVSLEVVEAMAHDILADLASEDPKVRAAAAERIVTEWPLTAPALDGALVHPEAAVRTEAVRLLGRKELGDTTSRLRRRLSDESPVVRRNAVRVVRHLKLRTEEAELIRIMQTDAVWPVRFEAARTLEDVGTLRCLNAVLAAWERETDDDRKRPFVRVMRRLTGADHGGDVEAWRKEVDELLARGERQDR